jgi:deoxyribose-phosphate aldolase
MRNRVGKDFGIKAAGRIRTLEDASKMIEAGANLLGTSSSVVIIQRFDGSKLNPS